MIPVPQIYPKGVQKQLILPRILTSFYPARRAKNPVFMRVFGTMLFKLGYKIVPRIKIWGTKHNILPLKASFGSKKRATRQAALFRNKSSIYALFRPYLFASSTATAQATVAPTIGLLPYQSFWIFCAFILVLYIVESPKTGRFEALRKSFWLLEYSRLFGGFSQKGYKRGTVPWGGSPEKVHKKGENLNV